MTELKSISLTSLFNADLTHILSLYRFSPSLAPSPITSAPFKSPAPPTKGAQRAMKLRRLHNEGRPPIFFPFPLHLKC
ncbi:hypothetical protein JTE90_001252 [Oedothorax gibbosus]|uniref:Uncharacterized protein n=1 Tax=Oedothorax gibbosus TaxID=931172 RepID=A0AAV6VX04_9ARAC|nr:hypothetical protein JTE90_001252 [Oedothorax gibbosus]